MSQGTPSGGVGGGGAQQPRPQPRVPRSRTQPGQTSPLLLPQQQLPALQVLTEPSPSTPPSHPPQVTPRRQALPPSDAHSQTLPPLETTTALNGRSVTSPSTVTTTLAPSRLLSKHDSIAEEDIYSDDSITSTSARGVAPHRLDDQTAGAARLAKEQELLREREVAMVKREQEVYRREEAVSDREYTLNNREIELQHTEDELHVKKKEQARREFELDMEGGESRPGASSHSNNTSSRMAEIADKELELQHRETDMNQREANWRSSLEARERELLRREGELEQRVIQLEQQQQQQQQQTQWEATRPQNQTQWPQDQTQWDSRPINFTAPQSQTLPRNFSTSNSGSGYTQPFYPQSGTDDRPPESGVQYGTTPQQYHPPSSPALQQQQPGFKQQQPGSNFPRPSLPPPPPPLETVQPGNSAFVNPGSTQFASASTPYTQEPVPSPSHFTPAGNQYIQEPQYQDPSTAPFVAVEPTPQYAAASQPSQTPYQAPGYQTTPPQAPGYQTTPTQAPGYQTAPPQDPGYQSTPPKGAGQSSDSMDGKDSYNRSPQKKITIDADAELALSLSQDRNPAHHTYQQQQISDDERLARELQEEEDRQGRAAMATTADAQLALQMQRDMLNQVDPLEGVEGAGEGAGFEDTDFTHKVQQELQLRLVRDLDLVSQEEQDRRMARQLEEEEEGEEEEEPADIPPDERNDLNL